MQNNGAPSVRGKVMIARERETKEKRKDNPDIWLDGYDEQVTSRQLCLWQGDCHPESSLLVLGVLGPLRGLEQRDRVHPKWIQKLYRSLSLVPITGFDISLNEQYYRRNDGIGDRLGKERKTCSGSHGYVPFVFQSCPTSGLSSLCPSHSPFLGRSLRSTSSSISDDKERYLVAYQPRFRWVKLWYAISNLENVGSWHHPLLKARTPGRVV